MSKEVNTKGRKQVRKEVTQAKKQPNNLFYSAEINIRITTHYSPGERMARG